MEKDSESESSAQILGDWKFPPVDPFPIVMVSPPSSPEPMDVDRDGSDSEVRVRDLENERASAEIGGVNEKERATASKSPSSATGKARDLEKQPDFAGNPDVSGKKRAGASNAPSSPAINARVSQKKQAGASKSPSSVSGKSRVSREQHASVGKARVSEDESTSATAALEALSSFASERLRILEKKIASTKNVSLSENEPTAAAVGGGGSSGKGGPTRVLPSWIAGSEQWGGGKWKEDSRKKKTTDEKNDMIPLKQVIEALIRSSSETEEDPMIENFSYVEIFKSMGIKFPQ